MLDVESCLKGLVCWYGVTVCCLHPSGGRLRDLNDADSSIVNYMWRDIDDMNFKWHYLYLHIYIHMHFSIDDSMIQWNTLVIMDFSDFSEHPNLMFLFLSTYSFENFSYSLDVSFSGSNLPTAVSFRIPGRTLDETTTNCKAYRRTTDQTVETN